MCISNSKGISITTTLTIITTTLTITIACMAIIFIVMKYTLPSSLLPDKTFHYAYAQKQEKSPDVGSLSLSNLIDQGSPHLGSKSAPVTVIDFSDFQCYLCNRFVKATEPQLNATYVQTGKVNLVFKHLPNRGFDSMGASLAAQCTNDQDKFWEYHELLYKNQRAIDSGWVNTDNLKKFASQVPGLTQQQFNSCIDSQKYKSFIEKDIALARSFGFTETPSFIIVNSDGSNPEKIEGPQPFPSFKALIDKKLEGS